MGEELGLQKTDKRELKNIIFDKGIIPKDYDDVMRFAGLVHGAGMAPKGFDTPAKVAVGILTNVEQGRPAITGLQDLAIINGRCGTYGNAITAKILASGLMEEGYPKETETGTPYQDDWTFAYTVKRKGRPEVVGKWTWEDAKRAGFDDPKMKDGRKDIYSPWTRFTRRMMQWKARSFVNQDQFGDILRGMTPVEDLYDIVDLEKSPNGTYKTPQQKADDLTARIKNGDGKITPEAQELKDKLAEGDKGIEGYQDLGQQEQEEKPEPEPEETLSLFEQIKKSRPSTSPENRAKYIKLHTDNADAIRAFSIEERDYVFKKWQKACPGELFPARPLTEDEKPDPPQEEEKKPDVAYQIARINAETALRKQKDRLGDNVFYRDLQDRYQVTSWTQLSDDMIDDAIAHFESME